MEFVGGWEGVDEYNQKNIYSKVFPNPARNLVSIDFENPEFHIIQLTVFDHTGKQIFRQERIIHNTFNLNTEDYNNGLYHYQLVDTEKLNMCSGKFVINK